MSILVDSSIWSVGLRRRKRHLNPDELKVFYEWQRILIAGDAAIIGPVRQEVLSGIVSHAEFEAVKRRLYPTHDLQISTDTYVLAAKFFNTCRSAGVAPGPIDMTICAAAHNHAVPIFTTDLDFVLYARHLPIKLHRF